MLAILLMATLTSLPITAGLYVLFAGAGEARSHGRHAVHYEN